jgi:hypothetical protein
MTHGYASPRTAALAKRFHAYLIDGLPTLIRHGYHPHRFQQMVDEYGGVGSAKRLLADRNSTADGLIRLYRIRLLHLSVEYAVSLDWFRELFDEETELREAEVRLTRLDFPLQRRLRQEVVPNWVADLDVMKERGLRSS